VRERIHKLTGATSSTGAVLHAEGAITQTDSAHFHLKLVTRSGKLVGERNLNASSCENLTGAAAVSLALLLRSAEPLSEGDLRGSQPGGAVVGAGGATGGPTASGTEAPTGTGATSTAATTSTGAPPDTLRTTGADQTQGNAPKSSSAVATANAHKKSNTESGSGSDPDSAASEIIQRPIVPSPRRWRFLAQAPLAVLSFGPLPEPSWGLALAGGFSLENWRLSLGGSAWLRQSVTVDQATGDGADVDRLTGTFKACHTLGQTRFEVAPCLALSLEHVSARGTGAAVTGRSEQTNWLALGVGAQGRLLVSTWLALLVGVDAQIETARPVISIEGASAVRQLGPAALTVTVGPEWIL